PAQQPLQHFFPRRDPAADLVLIQTLEDIALQAKPRHSRIVCVHQILPHFHRKAEMHFFVPWDRNDLQRTIIPRVENCSAELHTNRDLSVLEASEELGSGDVEVESARYRNIDPGDFLESRNDYAGVRPEEGFQGFVPAFGLAKQIEQALLFQWSVMAARGF